tara:strand:+ start:531 stop:644 length:114 start_codon:yes stop_codon:yes gene_type:complete
MKKKPWRFLGEIIQLLKDIRNDMRYLADLFRENEKKE